MKILITSSLKETYGKEEEEILFAGDRVKSSLNFEKVLNNVIGSSNKRWRKLTAKYSTEILKCDPGNIKKKDYKIGFKTVT